MNPFTDFIDKIRQQQQLLAILIFFLVAVMMWIAVSLISIEHQSTISPELKKMALPLIPRIDETILSTIEQKRVFTSGELQDFPIYKIIDDQTLTPRVVEIHQELIELNSSPSPSPLLSPSPAATSSPSTTPPISTQSGTVGE